MNKPLKISFFASGIILFFGFYFFYPFGLPNVKNYFEPIGERTLQKDEIGQFNYVYNTYEIMDLTGDDSKVSITLFLSIFFKLIRFNS